MRLIKTLYHRTTIGHFVIQFVINFRLFINDYFIPDKKYIKSKFKQRMGFPLNLENPRTLNEKINWLKIFYRTPLHTQCADKYEVRKFISEKIGQEYLVPLLYMTKNPKDLIAFNLPEEPFIIKTNHDSGGGVVVKNKLDFDWEEIQKVFSKRLSRNYYRRGKEWQYKNIIPRIIVEKLLSGKDGSLPFDYKLHCFNGKVNMIQVDIGRFSENHHRNWYNVSWEREPYRWSSRKGNHYTDPSDEDIEKPRTLSKMIELSEVIAQEFPYVRVDWYDVEGQLFFGEITFHHDGGYSPIYPSEWDLKLGDQLNLPMHQYES